MKAGHVRRDWIYLISGIVCAIPFIVDKTFFLMWICAVPLARLFLRNDIPVRDKRRGYFLFAFGYYLVGNSFFISLYFAGSFASVGVTGIIGLPAAILCDLLVSGIHGFLFLICAVLCDEATKNAGIFCRTLAFPCITVLAEYLQTFGTFAFPWCRIFLTQTALLPLLQTGSLFGAGFVAYVVMLCNALAARSSMQSRKSKRFAYYAAAVLVFICDFLFGAVRSERFSLPEEGAFTAVAVQGNVPSTEKWSGSVGMSADRYEKLLTLAAERLEGGKPALILLPETAVPDTFDENSDWVKRIGDFCRENDVTVVLGAFSENRDGVPGNSLFAVMPDGTPDVTVYTKRKLVPFGEYMPFRRLWEGRIELLDDINMMGEDLYSGESTVIWQTQAGKAGGVICFESIFPETVRETVLDGAEILLVSTNDSWFAGSHALSFHLYQAVMRAIETGRPVIRAANTGISALIEPNGLIAAQLSENVTGAVTATLHKSDGITLYARIGDVFPVLCALFLAGCAVFGIFEKKRKKRT